MRHRGFALAATLLALLLVAALVAGVIFAAIEETRISAASSRILISERRVAWKSLMLPATKPPTPAAPNSSPTAANHMAPRKGRMAAINVTRVAPANAPKAK